LVGLSISISQAIANESEYKLTAAYVFQFTKYITWPAKQNNSEFVISIIDDPDLEKSMEKSFQGKTVNGKNIKIRNFEPSDVGAPLDILFFSKNVDASQASSVLQQIDNKGVLTIGYADGFASNGGMINFFLENQKLRFEINWEKAKEKNFNIASRLLGIARIVK